jgi:hypothetical protein
LRSPSIAGPPARILAARWSGGATLQSGGGAASWSVTSASADASSEAPQALQNFWPSGFEAAQFGQLTVLLSASPQFPQKRAAEAFECPQEGQSMADPYYGGPESGVGSLTSAAR